MFRCWAWTVLAILAFVPFSIFGGLFVTYYTQHRLAPPINALIIVGEIGLLWAVGSAIYASLLVASRRLRWLAGLIAFSPLPVAVLLAIGYLAFGIWPGPSRYHLYAGATEYGVPWQYDPSGNKEPGPASFVSARVFSPSYRPRLGGTIGHGEILTFLYLRPAGGDLREELERWRSYLGSTEESKAFGLAKVISADPERGISGPAHVLAESTIYYSRDIQGAVTRLITCDPVNRCEHRVVIGDWEYRTEYPVADIAQWQSFEQRTISLFRSFAIGKTITGS